MKIEIIVADRVFIFARCFSSCVFTQQGAGAWYYYENKDNGKTFDKYDAQEWNEKKKAEFEKSKK